MTRQLHCPVCAAGLAPDVPLQCVCGWHLITLAEWQKMKPFEQGYVHYMQSAWPTSELASADNPHAAGTKACAEFKRGEERAMLSAQDGEE